MQKIIQIFSLILIFSISSCEEPIDLTLIHGTWQADQYLANGKPKKSDPANIGFTFNAQNIYSFKGGLSYKEAGPFRIERDVLYTTDTLGNQRIEKAVRIAHISADSLHFKMNNNGIPEEIILHKVK